MRRLTSCPACFGGCAVSGRRIHVAVGRPYPSPPVVQRRPEHRLQKAACSTCLNQAMKAVYIAHQFAPVSERWEAYACEVFLLAFTHGTDECRNNTTIEYFS